METENDAPKPHPYISFGTLLAAALRESNLSPPDLARHLDISPQMVGKYLRGESLPAPERLNQIGLLLKVDPADLLLDLAPSRPGRRSSQIPPMSLGETSRALEPRDTAVEKFLRPFDPNGANQYEELLHLTDRKDGHARRMARDRELIRERETIRAIERELLRVLAHQSAKFNTKAPLTAAGECYVRGGYYDQFVDLALLRAGVPQFAVEVRSVLDVSRLGSVLGAAANWKAATGGRPYYFVWVITDSVRTSLRFQQCREALHAMAGMTDLPFQRGLLDPDPVRPPAILDGLFEIDAANIVRGMMDFEARMIEAITEAARP